MILCLPEDRHRNDGDRRTECKKREREERGREANNPAAGGRAATDRETSKASSERESDIRSGSKANLCVVPIVKWELFLTLLSYTLNMSLPCTTSHTNRSYLNVERSLLSLSQLRTQSGSLEAVCSCKQLFTTGSGGEETEKREKLEARVAESSHLGFCQQTEREERESLFRARTWGG